MNALPPADTAPDTAPDTGPDTGPDTAGAAPAGGRPRAVLFDLFHTLVCLRPGIVGGVDRGEPTWKALGVDRDAWESSFFSDHDGRAVGRVKDAVESVRLVAHRIDPTIPLERIRRVAAQRERRFEDALLSVHPGVLRGLRRLRAAGVRTGLVSNASWEEVRHWDRSPLAALMETATFSCAAGVAKPDAAIYERALTALGVTARDTWFVGDGGSDEHRGARAVGMTHVLVLHLLRRVWPDRIEERAAHAAHVFENIEDVAEAAIRARMGA